MLFNQSGYFIEFNRFGLIPSTSKIAPDDRNVYAFLGNDFEYVIRTNPSYKPIDVYNLCSVFHQVTQEHHKIINRVYQYLKKDSGFVGYARVDVEDDGTPHVHFCGLNNPLLKIVFNEEEMYIKVDKEHKHYYDVKEICGVKIK